MKKSIWTPKDCVSKLALAYREPATLQSEVNGETHAIVNPQIRDATMFIAKAFGNNREGVKNFYRQVRTNFEPTNASPFPTPFHLKKIYDEHSSAELPQHGQEKYIPLSEVQKEVGKNLGIGKDPSIDLSQISFVKMLEEDQDRPADYMYKTYGIKLMARMKKWQGEYAYRYNLSVDDLKNVNFVNVYKKMMEERREGGAEVPVEEKRKLRKEYKQKDDFIPDDDKLAKLIF